MTPNSALLKSSSEGPGGHGVSRGRGTTIQTTDSFDTTPPLDDLRKTLFDVKSESLGKSLDDFDL